VTATPRLLCLGYGYTAHALAMLKRKEGWRVAGTVRSDEKARALDAIAVEPVDWRRDALGSHAFDETAAILVSTPPDEDGCPALAAAAPTLRDTAKDIAWIGYLSTNGVYGDYGGAWVTEESELRATAPRARRRIAAEDAWRAFADKHGLPLTIFRLPGIYGPGRSAIDTVREGRAKRIVKEGQVFSRMHVDDIANALDASMKVETPYDLFNLADDEPAPPQDVITYACDLLGVEPPPLTPLADADLSEMAKSFYADNKRVSNQRMKRALAVKLKYPTYREGLRAILDAEA